MALEGPFHDRLAAGCSSWLWKDWAGFAAVRRYEPDLEPEYFALREQAGLIDVSPLHKYAVEGPQAGALLAFVTSRDLRSLAPGRVAYLCLCDERGKVIDDGTVARLAEDRYRLTTASPALHWLLEWAQGFDARVHDVSEEICALAVQGPTSRDVLARVAGPAIAELRYFGITAASAGGLAVEVSRTGYTGDLGYEVWADPRDAGRLWDLLAEAGRSFGLRPVGLDALDMARIEAGFVLQDVDYFSAPRCVIESRKSSPFEIGLGWTVELDREPFLGQQALREERARGPRWALVGLELDQEVLDRLYDEHGLPPRLPAEASREAVPVYDGPDQVGQMTSSTWSPILKKAIGLASVDARYASLGTQVAVEHTVEFARRRVPARVVQRPFFDPPRKRR